ncbi:MAG: Rrf2 family transcriptional regulator [Actinomycetota bacterium]|nr:Rrf2 family transcriptional regulator [Actinomycetota bacterium]
MADFLDEKRREISARLKELKPLADEYHRLAAAAEALETVPNDGNASAAVATPAARRPARSRRSTRRGAPATDTPAATTSTDSAASAPTARRRRGRPKGSGTRGTQALELVRANPGATIPELAEKMGIKQNYLYRVLPGLAEDGLVEKRGRGWHPKAAA